MNVFNEESIQVDRIWCGEGAGTKLRVEHVLSGMVVECVIGFEDEKTRRDELIAKLKEQVLTKYPPSDFLMHFFNCGPGKGESLQLEHKSTGVTVERFAGYEKREEHVQEMIKEMFAKLRER
jgi:hypothetical protein